MQQFETNAQALLELLHLRGIECFLANPGTDFTSIVDAFARRESQGEKYPRPIAVPHETPLVAMAHGYYMVTGKPLAAMVHVGAGTANGVGAMMAAHRGRVPILFMAGRTPISEWGNPASRSIYIHWGQECYDQAAFVREFVKWDYELRSESNLEAVIDRALTMSMTEPRGPVYLTLPREPLTAPFNGEELQPQYRYDLPTLYPDPEKIQVAADLIAQAESPLVITSSLGRRQLAVESLVEFSEMNGCGVISFNPEFLNFPPTHPCHLGFEIEPFISKSDLILVLDCDVPWYPNRFRPDKQTKIIQIGIDPFYSGYPIRSFPSDVTLQGEPSKVLTALNRILATHPSRKQDRIDQRVKTLRDQHLTVMDNIKEYAMRSSQDIPINRDWVASCINDVLGDNTILVNEHDNGMAEQPNLLPGRFFEQAHAGYLGWGMGAALGAKLAHPDQTVIATVGDGSYMFDVPSACHFVSNANRLPILTVIFNNQSWHAVKRSTQAMYPEGWAVRTDQFPLCDLQPIAYYEKFCEAFGGYGERVEDPSQIKPAIDRALRAVREENRQAVLNIICQHP
ncbi:thiamine pyrophosphate-requiring protein [Thermodesulfobacteriota bacterium]